MHVQQTVWKRKKTGNNNHNPRISILLFFSNWQLFGDPSEVIGDEQGDHAVVRSNDDDENSLSANPAQKRIAGQQTGGLGTHACGAILT
jgi:hypothetical protein